MKDAKYYHEYYLKNKKRILENKKKRLNNSEKIFKEDWEFKYKTLKESFLEVCKDYKELLLIQLDDLKINIIYALLLFIGGIDLGLIISQLI